jgi:hypothetical protein
VRPRLLLQQYVGRYDRMTDMNGPISCSSPMLKCREHLKMFTLYIHAPTYHLLLFLLVGDGSVLGKL